VAGLEIVGLGSGALQSDWGPNPTAVEGQSTERLTKSVLLENRATAAELYAPMPHAFSKISC